MKKIILELPLKRKNGYVLCDSDETIGERLYRTINEYEELCNNKIVGLKSLWGLIKIENVNFTLQVDNQTIFNQSNAIISIFDEYKLNDYNGSRRKLLELRKQISNRYTIEYNINDLFDQLINRTIKIILEVEVDE